MTWKSALYALAVVVLTGSMAVVALADDHGVNMYDPAESSVSTDVGTSEAHADEWELREAMETGALPPDRPADSYDAACCSGIEEPTVEGGGQLFRPEIDSGA